MRAALQFVAVLLLCCSLRAAQAKSGAASRSAKVQKPAAAALRSECLDSVGLCISVPAAWQRVGEIFDGFGFVVAEPGPSASSANWPHLTVAAIEVSPKESDGNTMPASLDAVVERMLTPGGALASANVLERSSLLINGANAQIVRVGLTGEGENGEAIETVALIEGEEGLVYSVALHCSPPEFSRLEPVFRQSLQSWHLQNAEAAPTSAPDPAAVQPKPTEPKQSTAGSTKTKP